MTIDRFEAEYSWLSNFSSYPATYQGVEYPTAEHAFQAAKTLDLRVRDEIKNFPTPGKAKRAGRTLHLRDAWEGAVRYQAMKDILRSKFSDPQLRDMLLATGDQILIEGNSWGDHTWGQVDGKGVNLLGWFLMELRDELRGIHE